MKTHTKRTRLIRALALAGCVTAVAGPGAAMAKPIGADNVAVRHENSAVVQHSSTPSGYQGYESDSWTGGLSHPKVHKAYTLPSGFHTDAQSSSPGVGKRQFSLPPSFKSDVPSSTTSTPSSIIHEIKTVTDHGDRTLPIVLAACALGIALCGTGFAAVRLTRIQRQVLGSSS